MYGEVLSGLEGADVGVGMGWIAGVVPVGVVRLSGLGMWVPWTPRKTLMSEGVGVVRVVIVVVVIGEVGLKGVVKWGGEVMRGVVVVPVVAEMGWEGMEMNQRSLKGSLGVVGFVRVIVVRVVNVGAVVAGVDSVVLVVGRALQTGWGAVCSRIGVEMRVAVGYLMDM